MKNSEGNLVVTLEVNAKRTRANITEAKKWVVKNGVRKLRNLTTREKFKLAADLAIVGLY